MNENMSFKELFGIIKHRLLLIFIMTAVVTLITGYIQFRVISPVYQASTQVLIHETSGEKNSSLSDIQLNLHYNNTFQTIMKSPVVLEKVKHTLHLSETASALKGKIATSSETDSEIITVAVQDQNPARAAAIANTMIKTFKQEVRDRMNMKGVVVLSEAKASESPMVKPSRLRNIIMAFGAALMAGVTLAFFLHFLDETIKSERQLSEKTDLPVLGVVYDIKNKQTQSDEKYFGE
ncbi:YveK family protein [Bacillus nakamurai]|uniref:YveK family protein n=1 Tax=Bacillus nakamurai TaxID=1793963 RepID=UPI0020C57D86|nr:Wzz/FepE/Etk N-terminal domain-containing protein [Bacillus nakamurai]MCP6683372.1 Wzz/FepE/Etk N-terminal domain-containing protein [Bacillus nakamurai]